MMRSKDIVAGIIVVQIVTASCSQLQAATDSFNLTGLTGFPKGFIFSTATASYQVEGAWNVSGKGENIWDYITHHNPNYTADHNNGDIACDSYNKYKEDVANIKQIGFQMYRFSLSWSRLFPSGFVKGPANQDGVRYYKDLIDELHRNGIEPMVTIFHWDLPQPLQELGGWLNSTIADWFEDYSRAVYKLFGDKVKWWLPINEPKTIVDGYNSLNAAPALNLPGTGEYIAAHNLIRAHARAYRVYDKEFRKEQKGKVGINLSGEFKIPKNPSDAAHVAAAETANQFLYGWFGHPVLSKEGDYPKVMRDYVDKASQPGPSRLPYFTPQEIQQIKGTYDYLALNHYSSYLAEPGLNENAANPSSDRDQQTIISYYPDALPTHCPRFQVTPEGFRKVLNWLKKEYNDPEIFITENGYCDKDQIEDNERIHYYTEYMKQMLLAIKEDGCNVIGHTTWSLMDNLEWALGYTMKFGLIRVDFTNPNRTRTLKKSAHFFKALIEKNVSSLANRFIANFLFISVLAAAAGLFR